MTNVAQTRIRSIAIAGAWGYIGRKFLAAADQLGLQVLVHDPGPVPGDVNRERMTLVESADQFYRSPADLFHLALHPQHRAAGLNILLARSAAEPILILCEKPLAEPARPVDSVDTVELMRHAQATVLYDFPELFDPMTQRILEFLRSHQEVQIERIVTQRSKDREDPAIQRNQKRMVHIQYQESVHCLAFALYLLAHTCGGIAAVFSSGLEVRATALPYQPPNPHDYPYVVDGKCEFQLNLGAVQLQGLTDFTRGAPWSKRREIIGRADGQPFSIVADYLEGRKLLLINGLPQADVIDTNSYVEVIRTLDHWIGQVPAETLSTGIYPHPDFARITYQLSGTLWRSSWTGQAVVLDSLGGLLAWDAEFAAAEPSFPHYL